MIGVTHHGKIAVLTLAHGKANTLDPEFCRAVTGEFARLKKSPAEAVVLTAEGPIFCAGVNLIRASQGGPKYLRTFLPALNKMYDAIFNFPKPVVAAVNGHAIAGGCVLSSCTDYRMMARGNGRVGVTELLVGLPFPALAFEVMRFVTGPRYFSELIYTGNTYSPDDALERGLVHEVVEPAALQERALASARMLADLSPAAFSQTKAQMRVAVTERIKRDGKKTDAAVTKIWTSAKATQTINAYVAKTLKK
jgi:enoyl-CoA hydratase